MNRELSIKKLNSQEVQDLKVRCGVKRDEVLSNEYFFDVYQIEEKVIVALVNGEGIEFLSKEIFVSYYKNFISEIKDVQKENLRKHKRTLLLAKQIQNLLSRESNWSFENFELRNNKQLRRYRNIDGRILVLHENQSGTLYLSEQELPDFKLNFNQELDRYNDDGIVATTLNHDYFNSIGNKVLPNYSLTLESLPDYILHNIDDWILEKIKYYKTFDLFKDIPLESLRTNISSIRNEFINYLSQLSHSQIIEFCSWFYSYDDKGNIILNAPNNRVDLDLLRWDNGSTWHTDEYFDCLDLNLRYTACLYRLSEISNKVFIPKNIIETWNENIVEIIFNIDGVSYSIFARGELERFDEEVIGLLNEIIKVTSYFFDVEGLSSSHNPYEKMLVILLNKEKQERLKVERHLFSSWQSQN
jgi:hypothetical protein